jgi:hypothetical protein
MLGFFNATNPLSRSDGQPPSLEKTHQCGCRLSAALRTNKKAPAWWQVLFQVQRHEETDASMLADQNQGLTP